MRWFEQVRAIWSRLPASQRVFMASVAVALVILVVLVASWAGRQEYSVLYANLDSESAGAIVDKLRAQDIDYRLKEGGRTILVPRARVYDARLDLASAGLPHAAGQGYEILDSNKMGWTDLVQKLQFRRALEGEISRTIATLDEIVSARVHLVMPEPSLFEQDEKPTTASVVIKLRTGASLRDAKVQGIVHLVSAGVEGLQPDNITVLDTRGRLLSRPVEGDTLLGNTADQIHLTGVIETGLARKAQSALEQVLGPNRAVVRVSAELDFERVETTREIFDSANPVVRSEQRTEQTSEDAGTSEESVTNYEISKTIQHAVDTPGTIKRLSASVFIDGTYETGEDATRGYVPRDAGEMQKLEALIKTAIGFDASRGDQLTMENIAFDDSDLMRSVEEMNRTHHLEMIQKIGSVVVSVLLAGGVLLVLLKLMRRAGAGAPVAAEADAVAAMPDEDDSAVMPGKDIRVLRLEKKVKEISALPPVEIARIIRTWMNAV